MVGLTLPTSSHRSRSLLLPLPSTRQQDGNKDYRLTKIPKSQIRSLYHDIKYNVISEFKVGWTTSYIRRRDMKLLCQALSANSSITHVSVGWRLKSSALHRLLLAISRLSNLQHLSVVLHTTIPEVVFRSVLACPTLETLDMRDTKIHTLPQPKYKHAKMNHTITTPRIKPNCCSRPIIRSTTNQDPVQIFSPSIKVLRLIGCGMPEGFLHEVAGHCELYPMKELSLTHTKDIPPQTLKILCSARIQSLNLSMCDLGPKEAHGIIKGLKTKKKNDKTYLQNLNLSRNYRLGTGGNMHNYWCAFLHACMCYLRQLNLSYCSLSHAQLSPLWKILEQDKKCKMESLTLILPPLQNEETSVLDGSKIEQCLIHNRSLKSLILVDEKNNDANKGYSENLQQHILNAMQCNNVLENVGSHAIDPKLKLYLGLNHFGRRILCSTRHANDTDTWINLLSQSGIDLSTTCWLFRNGGHSALIQQK